MSRKAIAVDRVAVLLLGLLLIVVGLAGIAWWAGQLPGDPASVDAGGVVSATASAWWPWAVGAAGVVLALLALRWLFAHVPHQGVKRLTLPGSGRTGRLQVQTDAVTDAASRVMQSAPGIRSARSHTVTDRGQLVTVFDVTIEQDADLAAVAALGDATAADLRTALGRDDVTCRVNLKPALRQKALPRVS